MVLIGVVGGVSLSAAAGARRTATSLDRFRRTSRAADVELAIAPPTAAQISLLRHSPHVVAVGTLNAFAFVLSRGPDLEEGGAVADSQFGVTVDRTRIVAGRAPDPRAPNEVAIGEALASQLHVGVGGLVASGSYSPAQIAATLAGTPNVGTPAGPHIRLHVVGIERRVSDLGDSSVAGGLLVFTPAFARTYAHRVGVFGSLRAGPDHRRVAGRRRGRGHRPSHLRARVCSAPGSRPRPAARRARSTS